MNDELKNRILKSINKFSEKTINKGQIKMNYTKKSNMTAKPQTKTTTSENKTYSVSSPVEYETNGEKKTYWQDLGRGFETKTGLMLRLNALPTNGTIFVKENDFAARENNI